MVKRSRLVWDDDVEEIDLSDGDFITVGKSLTIKDMASVGAGESQIQTSLALLQKLIRAWRGPSFERDGAPVEVNEENIGRLDMNTANVLSEKITSSILGDRMDDEEKKELIESSSPISVIP